MLDRDPAPEGNEATCLNCGRPLIGRRPPHHVAVTPDDDVFEESRFCSEECEFAYETDAIEELSEEAEEIDRAGAT